MVRNSWRVGRRFEEERDERKSSKPLGRQEKSWRIDSR